MPLDALGALWAGCAGLAAPGPPASGQTLRVCGDTNTRLGAAAGAGPESERRGKEPSTTAVGRVRLWWLPRGSR